MLSLIVPLLIAQEQPGCYWITAAGAYQSLAAVCGHAEPSPVMQAQQQPPERRYEVCGTNLYCRIAEVSFGAPQLRRAIALGRTAPYATSALNAFDATEVVRSSCQDVAVETTGGRVSLPFTGTAIALNTYVATGAVAYGAADEGWVCLMAWDGAMLRAFGVDRFRR